MTAESTTTTTTKSRSAALIDRYAMGGAILAYAASGLTREQEQARPGPEAWSIAELVAHLLDTDLVLSDRMKRVISEDDPPLAAFDADAWTARLNTRDSCVEEAVNLLTANRHWMTRVLRRLNDADFAREGVHCRDGRITLAEILAKATHHIDHHLRFLYNKRSKLGVALPPRYSSEALKV